MLVGAFALLERSLRIDARGWSTHLARLGLVGAIYLSLCYALSTQNMFGAPGFRFFQGIAYLDATFMTLLGLGFFSTAITEEKEEDTLGLMLMAGISPLGILAGKSGGRLWQALLLIAVQYPFTLLAITMGGISSSQTGAVNFALLSYMVMLAGLGLLCSTLASNSRRAGGWMLLGLAIYYIVPLMAQNAQWQYRQWVPTGVFPILDDSNPLWTFLDSIGNICIFLRMGDILATGFGDSVWSIQVLSNCSSGLVFGVLSWMFFGFASRNPATEASSRGLVALRRKSFRFDSGRPWTNPFVWKDFHFVSGGPGMMLIRVGYYGVITIWAFEIDCFKGSPPPHGLVEGCLLWMSFSLAVDAGMILARSLHDEVRGQTLASLMMLPQSSNSMIYHKFAGAMIGWLPGPVFEILLTLGTQTGRWDAWDMFIDDQFGFVVILFFALIPHFAALVSLYVRWGAVPIAIGMTIGAYFAVFATVMIFQTVRSTDYLFECILGFVLFCICLGCHIGVLLRVQALAAK